MKQIVRGVTNKNQDKTLDVIIMDCQNLYQEPSILPPMTVDSGKVGKDSDHNGVEALPRTNLAPEGSRMREEVRVQPFPDSGLAQFGCALLLEDWSILEGEQTSTSMVALFESHSEFLVNKQFPFKTVPYFTEELRLLKRRRQRAYRNGKRSRKYQEAKRQFEEKIVKEAIKYRLKIIGEVRQGKRNSSYQAIRKLGNQPGEGGHNAVVLSSYHELGLTPQQSAERLAEHFSNISKTVDPLNLELFHPALRQALEDGRTIQKKPVLAQDQVYRKMKQVTKPKSSVNGDVPMPVLKQFTFEYAKPASAIFNKIIHSSQWPDQWKIEQTIVISKCKSKQPQIEDDLRTISKTQWLSKLLENIIGDYICQQWTNILIPASVVDSSSPQYPTIW